MIRAGADVYWTLAHDDSETARESVREIYEAMFRARKRIP